MGRKKKEESISEVIKKPFSNLKDETVQGILAIIFFVVGVFLVLAAFDKAGIVGEKLFGLLSVLFGYGYYVLCLFFFMLSISVFQSLERRFSLLQTIGSVIFFLSALGIIEIVNDNGGGILGSGIANPLVNLFEVYATSIILIALLIISFLVTFNTAIELSFLRKIKELILRRKEQTQTEVKIMKDGKETTEEDEENEPATEAEKESSFKKILGKKTDKEAEEEFIPKKRRAISLKPFTPPPLSILEKDRGKPGVGDIKANANIIKRTLQNFGIAVEMDEVSIGPSVTRYALKPAEGVKLSKILGLQNNLELALAAHPVRIEAPIPGKSLVGV